MSKKQIVDPYTLKKVYSEAAGELNKEQKISMLKSKMKWNTYHKGNVPLVDIIPFLEVVKINFNKGMNIIDFGCGKNDLHKKIHQYNLYVGIDCSSDVIKSREQRDNCFFLETDILQFKMPDGKRGHMGFCLGLLETLQEDMIPKALLNISQSISNILIVVDTRSLDYIYTRWSARKWSEEIGDFFNIKHSFGYEHYKAFFCTSKEIE